MKNKTGIIAPIGNRNVTFDFIRGISALIVCCGHLRAVMFVDFHTLPNPSVFMKGFYFFTSLGHEAVMVFFVLSGFFVGGSVISKKTKFKFDAYLIARLSRLWTVLVPALILTLLVDQITGYYFPQVLSGEHYSELNSGPTSIYSNSFKTFFANLFFLQSLYSPVYGSNGPLWSLTYEFWYYITFPLLIISIGMIKKSRKNQIITGIILVLVFSFFTYFIFEGFVIWLLGAGVFLLYGIYNLNFNWRITLFSFVLFMGSLIVSKSIFIKSFIISSDLLVGISFAIFLLTLRNMEKLNWTQKYLSKPAFWLADISYTLYVIHFPIFILIYAFWFKDFQEMPNTKSLIMYIFILVIMIFFSRFFWYVFENNTNIVRKWMIRMSKSWFLKNE